MRYSRVNEFFYPGNAVHGEPDYGLADNFVRTAVAFANTHIRVPISSTISSGT